jgi:hypothetical protein
MCLEAICLKHLRGRENEVCCGCSTIIGIYLLCICNWILLASSTLNFLRMLKYSLDVAVLISIAINLLRVFFQQQLWLCCDSIRARKVFLHLMVFTTFIESIFFVCQCYVLAFPTSDDYCDYLERLPSVSFIPTCEGVLALFMSLNLLSLAIYWYFCCIAYEYYFIACNDVYLKEHERKTIAKETKKKMLAL